TNKEAIAIQEARKLNIPIIAILDTNSDPDGITYPVPGNDDAARAIQTYCDLIADAVLDGLAAGASASGVDLGASEAPVEPMLREAPAAVEAEAAPAGAEGVAAELEAVEAEKAEG
ncbi:MAG: 30S ribosomal protein S2, partial [Caulobacterales bacterium RIFOXYB1_FULL_67_16]